MNRVVRPGQDRGQVPSASAAHPPRPGRVGRSRAGGVQREGAVELLRVPVDGGPAETLIEGSFTVRGVAAAGGRRRRRGARPVRRRADRRHCRPPAAADRLRAPAGRDRGGAPDARADGDRPRRLPGARMADRADGAGPHPVLLNIHGGPFAQYGWRCSTRRRCTLGRVRGGAVQSARLAGLRRRRTAGDPGRDGHGGRRRRARLPRRRADRPGAWTPTGSA